MQTLTDIQGQVETVITELKRRSGTTTDGELALAIGTSQANISNWRSRGKVPKSILLKCEKLEENIWSKSSHYVAARIVAFRVAEYAFQTSKEAGSEGGRYLFYALVATIFPALIDVLADDIAQKERSSQRMATDIAQDLIENKEYLKLVWNWLKNSSAEEILSTKKLPQ